MTSKNFVSIGLCLLLGCGGSAAVVDPNTDEFDIDPTDQAAIDAAADEGAGAEGTYDWDEDSDVLTLTITASSFECGAVVGTIVATVTELTPTRMVWAMEDGTVVWDRVDNGDTGVVGVWRSDDPVLYLILSADGTAQVFGEQELCERPRNQESCLQTWPIGVAITIDGDLTDWDAIGQEGTLEDAAADYLGTDPGADLAAMKVEYSAATISILTQLYHPPSTAFQGGAGENSGSYRLTVRGGNGLSLIERVVYDPMAEAFVTIGDASGDITAAAGADGIEWQVDATDHAGEGFDEVELILVETIGCDGGDCGPLDFMDCGFFEP